MRTTGTLSHNNESSSAAAFVAASIDSIDSQTRCSIVESGLATQLTIILLKYCDSKGTENFAEKKKNKLESS